MAGSEGQHSKEDRVQDLAESTGRLVSNTFMLDVGKDLEGVRDPSHPVFVETLIALNRLERCKGC